MTIDFASYADDNTPYNADESTKKVIDKLEIEAKSLFKWSSDKQMKNNPIKYHLLVSSISQCELKTDNETIKSSTWEKLLGIKIDNKLRLNKRIEDLKRQVEKYMH